MDLLTAVGAGVAGLFLASILIVFLSSRILGRSRGGGGYYSSADRVPVSQEFSELDAAPPVRRSTPAREESAADTTSNSLIQEILSMELPDEPSGSTASALQDTVRDKEHKPRDPLVSLIEEFDLSGDSEAKDDIQEKTVASEDLFEELLGGGDESAHRAPAEERRYTGYPDCFGNTRECEKNCTFSEECRRTVEILGEFI